MNLPPPFVPADSVLTGLSASAGVAIGQACLISRQRRYVPRRLALDGNMVEAELARLAAARDVVRQELASARDSMPDALSSQAGIFDAHLLLLDDPILVKTAADFIQGERRNAEWAIVETVKKIGALLGQVEDAYIRSRLSDVEMVGQALIGALLGENTRDISDCPPGSILFTRDLNPTEVSKLGGAQIAGIVTERGSRTSHTAIIAQALGLPAAVGVKNALGQIDNGDWVILDGETGHVIINPDQDALDFYRSRQRLAEAFTAEIVRGAHLPAVTLDDHPVEVLGNLELMEELPAILSCGGEGIGLYRTEFLYLAKEHRPEEDELFEVYKRVVETAAPRPVVFRTLDVGFDKSMPAPGAGFAMETRNAGGEPPKVDDSALGLRGVRYSLKHPMLFKTQLRAILRASAFGLVKVMLPMVSDLSELRRGREFLDEAKDQLRREGRDMAPEVPLGVMIEVPSAVMMARELARESAFFSVGTNDLFQYSLAVARTNPEVADLYPPLHPAILRLLKMTVLAGREAGIPVSVCGDMAATPETAAVLIGLGIDTLSMPAAAIPRIKRLVRMSSLAELKNMAEAALDGQPPPELGLALADALRLALN